MKKYELIIWIREGNKVSLGEQYINSFKTFNEAWKFAYLLQQTIQNTAVTCDVFTQGGTWLTDDETTKVVECPF